jgi:hypothetical protein
MPLENCLAASEYLVANAVKLSIDVSKSTSVVLLLAAIYPL